MRENRTLRLMWRVAGNTMDIHRCASPRPYSQSLQSSLRHSDTAYVNFFRGHAKFPRFKSKRKKNSFTIPQFVAVKDSQLYFPKFKEGIKLLEHREMTGEVKHGTISKTPTGKFFVSILCEVQHKPIKPTKKQVGIDLGIKDFAVTSDGIRFKNNHHFKGYEIQLAKAQKHLSRKVKGSNGRNRQRLKVAFIHEKMANARHDLLHKVSTQMRVQERWMCSVGVSPTRVKAKAL